MYLSKTAIDTCLWDIQRELMQRHGCTEAERAMYPLEWYIRTGRASAAFLHCLINARPVLVARDLANGGTDEEVIARVCKRIKYEKTA